MENRPEFRRCLDAARGDLLGQGVSLPEDKSWLSMLSLGDRLGRDGDVERTASESLSATCGMLSASAYGLGIT